MNEQEKQQLRDVYAFMEMLKDSQRIPRDVETAFRRRIKQPTFASKIIDFGSVLSGASSSDTISVPGAELSDPVVLGIPSSSEASGMEYRAYVSAVGTVTIRIWNRSGGAIDLNEGKYVVAVLKQ